MPETICYKPHETAKRLGISPSTLRRWSTEFAGYLSRQASGAGQLKAGQRAHRRYTEDDFATLVHIRELLAGGRSYAEVRQQLNRADEQPADSASNALAVAPAPAVAFLSQTLHAVADGQQLLLNSQQANRDLLNLVIQDNFTLKEENAQLRERMMRLEQELSENRRREEARREMLERRLERIEDQFYRPPEGNPSAKVEPVKRRRSWLARLLGL